MKRLINKFTAVLLAGTVFITGVLGHYQQVKAAFVLPATEAGIAAGETLQWLYTVMLSMGVAINLKEMFRDRFDPDNWDWGDVLDDPASQEDINNLERKLWKEYDEAVERYLREHPNGSTPTPEPTKTPDPTQAPEISPPAKVTPAPTSVPPEILDKIDSWAEMRQKALQNKVLALGAGAAVCLKEAVNNWWDEIMDNTPPSTDLKGNPYEGDIKDYVGRCNVVYECGAPNARICSRQLYFYNTLGFTDLGFYGSYSLSTSGNGMEFLNLYSSFYDKTKNTVLVPWGSVANRNVTFYAISTGPGYKYDNVDISRFSFVSYTNLSNVGEMKSISYDFEFYVPYNIGGEQHEADEKPLMKPVIWPVPSLKGDYDNNNSPTLPTVPVPIIIPGLDELQELLKNANDSDDDNRPTIIQNFINNHTAKDPTPTPQPTPSTTPAVVPDPEPGTDPDPDPTGAPDPDPNPTTAPEATPNPTPAIPVDPDIDPKPSTAPKPNPTGSPDNPDAPGTDDVDPDKYKTDLRLVFPFCIPFDLIHLLEVLDAEPEAPRFEIPVNIEAENPFTKKKIVDYHTTIVIDMSDYEEPVKVIRIFEIMFFILGLMLITRQHMIKG